MRKIRSESEFDEIWEKSEALVCDFSAAWCGPCKMLEPVLKKVEKEHPEVAFVKVDVDEMFDLSERLDIQAMPTLLFVRKGKVLKRIVGVESHEVISREAKRLLKPAKGK